MGDTGRFRAMGEKEDQGKNRRRRKDMPVYDPDHLPYETHHACVLLRELADQTEENERGTWRHKQVTDLVENGARKNEKNGTAGKGT